MGPKPLEKPADEHKPLCHLEEEPLLRQVIPRNVVLSDFLELVAVLWQSPFTQPGEE